MQAEVGFFAEPRNWVVLAFVVFFVLFGRKLWGALAGMLDARAASVRAEMDEAARLQSEAEAMLRDAEAARAKAQADAKALIDGAEAEAARVAEATRAEAEASASAASKWRWTGSPRQRSRRLTRCAPLPPNWPPSRRAR